MKPSHLLAFGVIALLATSACSDKGAQMPDEAARGAWEAEVAKLLQGGGAKKLLQSPEYKKAVADRLALQEKEEQVREEASWFGKTGLSDSTEREMPRYLRREFGQTIFDKGALKAADLLYLGHYREGAEVVHYWRIAYEKETSFAYASINGDRESLDWGGRQPPQTGMGK
jgi:hypothetical protein